MTRQQGNLGQAARVEWAALGPVGRTSLVAVALSAVVAIILAALIPQQIEHHLFEGEVRSITSIAHNLAAAGLIPVDPSDTEAIAELDDEIRLDLLSSQIVRVKVWSSDGTITYSDVPELIGRVYPLSEDRIEAFNGVPETGEPDRTAPETTFERGLPPLYEFYVPVVQAGGEVVAVFEVYQVREHIDRTVSDVRNYVWLSLGIAIGLLATFLIVVITVNGRDVLRREALTEKLFGELVESRAVERSRIIGSLHDDIGQSLYRIHYGLEDLKTRADGSDGSIAGDLERLDEIVRGVDRALRSELRLLQNEPGEDLALGDALAELGEVTETESDIEITIDFQAGCDLSPTGRVALYRAAWEAITNVRKHALADSVELNVSRNRRMVRLEVVDDGVGIVEPEGLGLRTTRERLETLGGGLRVKPGRRGGTTFIAWVPAGECEDPE